MSRKLKHHEEEHENEERWLLTYADLITLLMAFFMVMYAMSQLDKAKFQAMAISLSEAFNGTAVVPLPLPVAGPPGSRGGGDPESQVREPGKKPPVETKSEPPRETALEKLGRSLRGVVETEGLGNSVTVSMNAAKTRLTVRLSDFLLFSAGSGDINPQADPLISEIGKLILQTGKQVRIEGHTDNIPIQNARFTSNWELSTARATNVIRFLVDRLGASPARLTASGYGEYRPVAPNDTPEGRAANRRVEFVILEGDEE